MCSTIVLNAQKSSALDSITNKLKPNININLQTDSLTNAIKGLVPDSTLPFYREVYGDLKAASSAMAAGLGVAIKELFEIVVTQQLVKSITNIVFILFAILFGWWCIRLGKTAEWSSGNWKNVMCVFFGIVCTFFTIWTFACSKETVTGLVNPKYGAIEDIVDMASEIKNGGHNHCSTCR
jgi:hypothetical protein